MLLVMAILMGISTRSATGWLEEDLTLPDSRRLLLQQAPKAPINSLSMQKTKARLHGDLLPLCLLAFSAPIRFPVQHRSPESWVCSVDSRRRRSLLIPLPVPCFLPRIGPDLEGAGRSTTHSSVLLARDQRSWAVLEEKIGLLDSGLRSSTCVIIVECCLGSL
ncbi:hypothetical protein GUJ93_ZPchr0002g26646 [Zizania palustris]|uniref:Uncharacterized protein n=1 Tax=Zizania palustris TaxID=103762 RepID=A0A8J5RY30_ZIZPA|nr:hypothetical protein GUJ93_ZPchr0002g26646 [Zizania palustris]